MNTQQKIWLFVGDIVAMLGLVTTGSSVLHSSGRLDIIIVAGIAVLIGIILALVGLYKYADKEKEPKQLYMITSIIYAFLGLLVMMGGLYDHSKNIAAIGVLISILSLISINIAAFKPNNLKVFNSINIVYTLLGLVLIGFGMNKEIVKNSNTYIITGSLMTALASLTTSLAIYKVDM